MRANKISTILTLIGSRGSALNGSSYLHFLEIFAIVKGERDIFLFRFVVRELSRPMDFWFQCLQFDLVRDLKLCK